MLMISRLILFYIILKVVIGKPNLTCSKKGTKQEPLGIWPVKVPENGGWVNIKCTGGLIDIQGFFNCGVRKIQKKIDATVDRKCQCRSECRLDTKEESYENCPQKDRMRAGLTYACIGGKQETTTYDPEVGEVRRCACDRHFKERQGEMKQEDIPGNGGWINMKCTMILKNPKNPKNDLLTWAMMTIHKVLYSCKHKEVSDPKQLAIVKKQCECCGECRIEANRKTFGETECPGTEDAKMNLWIVYSCDGGDGEKSVTDETTKFIPRGTHVTEKPQGSCDDNGCGAHARCSKGNPKRCECQVEGQTYPNCCSRGLSYTGQGCAKCEAAPKGGAKNSRDIPLDGGWININCGTGGCITLHKAMAGCSMGGDQTIHIPKVAHCKGKQTCNIKPTSAQFGVSCNKGLRRMWITWSCNSGRDKTTHHIPSRPTCRPGCKGGSVCRRIEGRDVCSCNRGLRYTGQGCAKCEAAPRAGAMKSRDIPLDGGSININCGTGGCITLNKVMAGCNPGANIHIPKVAYCEGKQTCSIKPTSAHFGVNCTGWRRMWITWACNSGRDRTRQYIPPKRIQYAKKLG